MCGGIGCGCGVLGCGRCHGSLGCGGCNVVLVVKGSCGNVFFGRMHVGANDGVCLLRNVKIGSVAFTRIGVYRVSLGKGR